MKDKSHRQSLPGRGESPNAVIAPRQHPESQNAPFSRIFRISELPEQNPESGFSIKITASPEECEALAEDFGLPAIDRLDAELNIFRLNGGRFRLTGFVDGDLKEICVVSLELFHSAVKAPIDLNLVEMPKSGTDRGRLTGNSPDSSLLLNLDKEQDPPETIVGGKIDLGAIAAEFLALNLNPYPKKPGVEFDSFVQILEGAETTSPFEVLKKLKDGQ